MPTLARGERLGPYEIFDAIGAVAWATERTSRGTRFYSPIQTSDVLSAR
jgi:hypothetical protein